MEGSGAYALFSNSGARGTENELLGGGGEVREAGDGEVFVVEGGVFAQYFVGLSKYELRSRYSDLHRGVPVSRLEEPRVWRYCPGMRQFPNRLSSRTYLF